MPKCVDCGNEFEDQGCPENRCKNCGVECHENQKWGDDDYEWDECEECPYIEDTINYEKLEAAYPVPTNEAKEANKP